MKVGVIDNEVNVREGLVSLIEKNCPQITSISQADGVKSGLELIAKVQPDLLFVDVEMDDGTGMDLLKEVKEINFQVIFITAFNKYAVDAFKFSAIDFLLKPIDLDDLKRGVDRAEKNLKAKSLSAQLSILHESLASIKVADKKIVLRDSESIHFVKVSEIIRCEADGAYTKFVLTPKREILVSSTLKEYEELLSPFGFIRVHHSHIINLKKIVRFDRKDGGTLAMENNEHVPISKRKKEELEHIINLL